MAPVLPQEPLARYIFSKRHIKANNTVRQDAFIPFPHPDLSVTQHAGMSDVALWAVGDDIAQQRDLPLKGRADLVAKVYLDQKLQINEDPTPENPNHVNVTGWPIEKCAQKIIALELAARAVYTPTPE